MNRAKVSVDKRKKSGLTIKPVHCTIELAARCRSGKPAVRNGGVFGFRGISIHGLKAVWRGRTRCRRFGKLPEPGAEWIRRKRGWRISSHYDGHSMAAAYADRKRRTAFGEKFYRVRGGQGRKSRAGGLHETEAVTVIMSDGMEAVRPPSRFSGGKAQGFVSRSRDGLG